jgi:pimeloyl-ACP methyl ester carboxylesterase
MLTTVSVYWLTGTATSSVRLYKEGRASWGQPGTRSEVPSWVAVFPGDFGVRAIAERENNVVHWSEFERGGHFPAMEVPDLLVDDVREFFRSLR